MLDLVGQLFKLRADFQAALVGYPAHPERPVTNQPAGWNSAPVRKTEMLQTISLLVENKPGALLRVTGLLGSRGYNIESLTVGGTLDPELSRMTIVVDVDSRLCAQVIKQMNKLINVLQATDVTDSAGVCREIVLLRVRAQSDGRTAVLKEAEIFGAR